MTGDPSSRFTAPLVVGVQQFRNWQEAGSIEATLAGLGRNTGNMMFTQALLSVLDGARWGSFALTPADVEGRDCIVIACANWINGFEDFGWLADRLEKTSLPVVLVGIGAQSSLSHELPALAPGTCRLLSLAADRSKSISTRGTFTSDVLAKIGFKKSTPTGCPSLLLAGNDGPSLAAPNSLSPQTICIHATRHGFQAPDELDRRLYRIAIAEEIDIILQSETPDIFAALGEELPPQDLDSGGNALENVYGLRAYQILPYLRDRGRCFSNCDDWTVYMKQKAFCIGTRIHGTVASLLAGTPATLIAHDSRTLEMAEIMSIPFVRADTATFDKAQGLFELYMPHAIAELSSGYGKYRSNFAQFFNANGLCCRV